jgi:hypothetical protein
MAIDPSIALQVQPAQIQNPLTTYATAATLQNAQQQNQLLGLSIQDKQREIGQNQAISDAFKGNMNADGTLNRTGALTSIAQSGYGSALPALTKTLNESDRSALELSKSKVEGALQQVGAIGQVLNGVTDQTSYDAARAWAVKNLGPEAAANMPAQYDPTLVAKKRQEALTVVQQLDEQHRTIADTLAQNQFTETQRHNQATEGNAAGQLAVSQGQLGVSQGNAAETARHNRISEVQAHVPAGYRANADGSLSPIPGGPADKGANLNEGQANAVAFGSRALDAQNILRNLEANGTTNTNGIYRAASSLPGVGGALGAATNWLNSDQQQSYDQAKRNFVSAVLRKESGAAISNEEFATEDKKYFPQAGDSAATIEQKARARDLVIEGLKAQAGPGASMIGGIIANANQDYSNQPKPAAQQPAAQKAPAPIDADVARAELLRRAQNNPALAARLQAMGH